MKVLTATLVATMLVTVPAFAMDPIVGSITYTNPHVPRLKKSPIGSELHHVFYSGSTKYLEWYLLQPDRSLKIVDRIRLTN